MAGGQAAFCMPLLGSSMDWVTIAAGIHHQYASPCSRTKMQFSAVRPLKIALRPLRRVTRYMGEGLQTGWTSGFAKARIGKAPLRFTPSTGRAAVCLLISRLKWIDCPKTQHGGQGVKGVLRVSTKRGVSQIGG